jgi:uncharacterized protein YidB (DUF937 family)
MERQARPAGRWEPTELGVHPVAGGHPRGSMPAYIRRPHDEQLRRVLDPEVIYSRLIVIRGDAGTGKSRAGYEAVADRLADWSLEYPPTAAALTARLEAGIPAGTVLWLGELRRYADADGGAAALNRLADLLDGEGHLVITTIWPEHWDAYVTAAGARRGASDPARAAGRLVAGLDELAFYSDPNPAYGGVIDVPARFTAEQLTAAAAHGDPVLAVAAAAAGPDGQVTQYLAGGPGLLRRHEGLGGDPQGQAIITAAMDAARLGYSGPLPAALLQDAAAGYQADQDAQDATADRQADASAAADAERRRDALAWASAEFDGAVRALEPVPAAPDAGVADYRIAGYRIAGYLEQHGHRTRQERLGPASLWDALTARAAEAGAGDLTRVAQAARDRGLFRYAAALWTAAVGAGSADAARRLVAHLREVNPEDAAPAARWAVGHVRLDDPWDLARLLEELRAAEAGDAVRALLARDPGGQVRLDDRWDAIELLGPLHAAGATEAVDILAARIVDYATLEYLPSTASMLMALHAAGASDGIRALVARDPARNADPEEPHHVALLLEALHAVGAEDAARALATWAAQHADLEGVQRLARLLKALRTISADDALQTLMSRDPVGHGTFQDPWEAAALLAELRAAQASDAVQALLARDLASHSHIDYADSVAWLLEELRAVQASEAIRTLLARGSASRVNFFNLEAVGRLAAEMHAAGDSEAVRTLATRAVGTTADNTAYFAELLELFRAAGADEAVRVVLARDPAGRARLDDPGNVAWLLEELRAAGDGDAVQTLLARDPAGQVRLDDPHDVARLLMALRAAGADQALTSLATRAAAGASLEDPPGVARLLRELQAAGAGAALQALLARDPARQVSLAPDQQRGVARLLTALRAAGADEAARALAVRAADAGMFDLVEDRASYRFGREPDGAAAAPWRWAELGGDPGAADALQARLPQAQGNRDRADPDEQGDGVGHDEGQVARGDAVADPQAEPDQQDREVPDRHITGGSLPEHPADLQDR